MSFTLSTLNSTIVFALIQVPRLHVLEKGGVVLVYNLLYVLRPPQSSSNRLEGQYELPGIIGQCGTLRINSR